MQRNHAPQLRQDLQFLQKTTVCDTRGIAAILRKKIDGLLHLLTQGIQNRLNNTGKIEMNGKRQP